MDKSYNSELKEESNAEGGNTELSYAEHNLRTDPNKSKRTIQSKSYKSSEDFERLKLKNNRSFSRDIGSPKRQTSKINKEIFFQAGSRSFEQKNIRQKSFNLKDNNDFVKMKTSMILNTNFDRDVWEVSMDNKEIIEAMLFTSRCISVKRKTLEVPTNGENIYENEFLTPEEKMMADFAKENKFGLEKCIYLNGDQYLYHINADGNNKKVIIIYFL